MIYLHKVLPLFVLPVGITLMLVIAGLRLHRRWLIWSGVAVLWLSSMPFVSGLAVRAAEGWAERGLAVDAPTADAIGDDGDSVPRGFQSLGRPNPAGAESSAHCRSSGPHRDGVARGVRPAVLLVGTIEDPPPPDYPASLLYAYR